MESELKQENTNLRYENAKLKFDRLFNGRPSTIRSFAFHGGLRIVYLIIGILLMIGSLIYFGMMAAALLVNESIADYLQEEQHVHRELAEYIADKMMPLQFTFSIVLLVLSICFLIMARLCRKIVRRNRYITELENTWLELKENI